MLKKLKLYRFLALIMTVALIISVMPKLVVADPVVEPLVLDLTGKNLALRICPEGYKFGDETATLQPYTGAYVITGTTNKEIYFYSDSDNAEFNVTSKDLTMTIARYASGIGFLNDNITINMTIEGTTFIDGSNVSSGSFAPIECFETDESTQMNLTMAAHSSFRVYGNRIYVISRNVNVNVTNDYAVTGMDTITTRDVKLSLPHTLDTVWTESGDGSKCTIGCTDKDCTATWSKEHDYEYTPTASDHVGVCKDCGHISAKAPHTLEYVDNGNSHSQHCTVCGYVSIASEAHTMSQWETSDDGSKCSRYCTKCGHRQTQEHTWNSGIKTEGTVDAPPYTIYTCTTCGAQDVTVDTANTMNISMTDEFGDGWNGAYLQVIRNGVEWKELEFEDGDEEEYYLTYGKNNSYYFIWHAGRYDEECGFTITFPDDTDSIVYPEKSLEDTEEGTVLASINGADYTEYNKVLAAIPDDLESYEIDDIIALYTITDSVGSYLGKDQQTLINSKTTELKAAVAALTRLADSKGHLKVDKGIVITATGYTLDGDLQETAYTGDYYLFGDTTEHSVVIKSGEHNIQLIGVSIAYSYPGSYDSPIHIENGASVTLSYISDNLLSAYDSEFLAGINVEKGATLILTDCDGILNIEGSEYGAGIGSNSEDDCGTVEIKGGLINVYGYYYGAAIGSGYKGNAGTIDISGGTVNAYSYGTCVIGGGDESTGGSIHISGGIIRAESVYGGDAGAAIGCGYDEARIDSIVIDGGFITCITYDSCTIIGGTEDSVGGAITINGGVIVLERYSEDGVSVLSDYVPRIIGNGEDCEEEESETNYVEINGGNIISAAPQAIYPAAKNSAGKTVAPYTLTVPENLADKNVYIRVGSDKVKSLYTTAYGKNIIVYLEDDTDVQKLAAVAAEASYSGVDAAINKAAALTKADYKDFSKVEAAIAAVIRGKMAEDQDVVDGYAAAIEAAIAALVKIENGSGSGNGGTGTGNGNSGTGTGTGDNVGNPSTGEHTPVLVWLCCMAVSTAGVLVVTRKKRNTSTSNKHSWQ